MSEITRRALLQGLGALGLAAKSGVAGKIAEKAAAASKAAPISESALTAFAKSIPGFKDGLYMTAEEDGRIGKLARQAIHNMEEEGIFEFHPDLLKEHLMIMAPDVPTKEWDKLLKAVPHNALSDYANHVDILHNDPRQWDEQWWDHPHPDILNTTADKFIEDYDLPGLSRAQNALLHKESNLDFGVRSSLTDQRFSAGAPTLKGDIHPDTGEPLPEGTVQDPHGNLRYVKGQESEKLPPLPLAPLPSHVGSRLDLPLLPRMDQ